MFGNEIIDGIVIVLIAVVVIWFGFVGFKWYIDSRAVREVQQEYQNSLSAQKK